MSADPSIDPTVSAERATNPDGITPRSRFRSGRVLRVVRRVHMYLGLFLVPWLLLFGISGVLFNHPNVGESVSGRPIPPAQLSEATGFKAWNPTEVATRIVDSLNIDNPTHSVYSLEPTVTPKFLGPVLLSAESASGRHTTLVDVERGRAFVISRQGRPAPDDVPFKQNLPLPGASAKEVETQLASLLTNINVPALEPLRARSQLAPELRFGLRDQAGNVYHATYNTGTAQLGGRLADAWSPVGASQLLGMLHTTHHFTPYFGFRWAWALFQDLLGLAMAFWGISGLVLWWQLKATRIAGAVSIALALGLATWVMWGTAADLMFGEVMQQLGPG